MERSHDLKFNNNQNEKCLNKVLSFFSEKDTNLIVVLFNVRNMLKYVLQSLASGRKVILTGRPEDESLYQKLLLNLPKEISPLFIKLAGENSLYL